MTKAQFRRRVVRVIELTITYSVAMMIISGGCIVVAFFVSGCLKLLGVAY